MTARMDGDDPAPVRLALLTCDDKVEAWQVAALQHLDDDVARIVLRIDVSTEMVDPAHPRGLRSQVWAAYRHRRLGRRGRAWQQHDAAVVTRGVPRYRGDIQTVEASLPSLGHATRDAIRRAGCDAVLNLVGRTFAGLSSDDVPHGMWEHRVSVVDDGRRDDPLRSATTPALLEAALVRVGRHESDDVVLQRGWIHAVPRSWAATIDAVHFAIVGWLGTTCRAIRRCGEAAGDGAPPRQGAHLRDPSMMGVVAGAPWRYVRWALRQLVWQEEWQVGIVDQPIAELFRSQELRDLRWLTNPSHRHYLADPFGLAGSDTILVEDFDYLTRRGFIAAVDVDGAVSHTVARPVLRTEGHMSYPYLFEWQDDVFCVPETGDQRRSTLLRARRFPTEWQEVAILIDGLAATDPTIVRHDGRWWLFCTDDDRGPGSNLHIYHAERLDGPWRPHDANPVKVDIRSARPAGTPFVVDGALIRPAQENSGGYGSGIVFNEVEHLSTRAFRERPVAHLRPDPTSTHRHGLHTVSAWGDRTLVDGKRKGPSLTNLVGRVRRRIL
jgi:hypothetical protein